LDGIYECSSTGSVMTHAQQAKLGDIPGGGQRRQDKNGSFPVISNFFWAATHIEAQSYSRATPKN